ncbi:hypothetical protein QBC45DRAFT_128862 [Copromyces sp. CBS 386.78]|nr:hypothetical protein QBC45DRAFT_128862 [Copromyces sp. CBS 386.78]
MMMYERPVHDLPGPSSPPGLTHSKSSKSSSLNSVPSDDDSVLADASHFEDIGLQDDSHVDVRGLTQNLKPSPMLYSSNPTSELRVPSKSSRSSRSPSKPRKRDASSSSKSRPTLPNIQSHLRTVNGRVASLGLTPELHTAPLPMRSLGNRSPSSTSIRQRSPSPNLQTGFPMKPRRSSWQSTRERKTARQLEMECDEDDGDDIPDGLVLDNVPISPRPPSERPRSRASSKAPSPERAPPKERVRSVGNGTPPVAAAQGSLRSPTWKSDTAVPTRASIAATIVSPLELARSKSWSAALAELNTDAKELTEKLEEHAEELEAKGVRSSTPSIRRNSDGKPRVKSGLPELPPLRKSNVMIDPLPPSKEKEAVLSRTRPSWLPPKDPAEERRHLKEYQRMMAQSIEAERRREETKKARIENRDTRADNLMHIWEENIIPRWDEAIRERRTRELWWRGIAPRSRGAAWSKAIGNGLALSDASFKAALKRANDAQKRVNDGQGSTDDSYAAAWFDDIKKDVEEYTFPDLRIFQTGGPLHQSLVDVLSAYCMYRSDIGYVPGCNTIAAILLLNLPTATAAFIALANILNRSLPLSFHTMDRTAMSSVYDLLLQTLQHKSPSLHEHLVKLPDHNADLYLGDIFTGLFTRHLALDEATRLWDVYVFEGDAVLVRAGIALLLQKAMSLMGTKTIQEVRAIMNNSSDGVLRSAPILRSTGEEDRWMRAVREAGKAQA